MRIQPSSASSLLYNVNTKQKQRFNGNAFAELSQAEEQTIKIRRNDIIAPYFGVTPKETNAGVLPPMMDEETKRKIEEEKSAIAFEEFDKRVALIKDRLMKDFGIDGTIKSSSESITADGTRFAIHYIETPNETMPNKVLIELPNGDVLVADTTEEALSVTNGHWNKFSRDKLIGSMKRSAEEYKDLFMQYIMELKGSGEVVEYKHGA